MIFDYSRVITKFLYLLVTLSNFIFTGVRYVQIKGCAMGTIFARVYANIGKIWKTSHILETSLILETFRYFTVDS